jgi:hypothetical protein
MWPHTKLHTVRFVYFYEEVVVWVCDDLAPPLRFSHQREFHPWCDLTMLVQQHRKNVPPMPLQKAQHLLIEWDARVGNPERLKKLTMAPLPRIVWRPGIRKCATSIVRYFFRETVANHAILKHTTLSTPERSSPFVFTFIRDPLNRFLSGVHQVYVMYRMGWTHKHMQKHNVTFTLELSVEPATLQRREGQR